jgi:hypothetical protein
MRDDEQHDDPHAALQPSELDALRALRRAEDPGRPLEERTVKTLRHQGLLAARHRSPTRPLAWAAAAASVFFAAGFALGRGSGRAVDASDTTVRTDRPAVGPRIDRERRDSDGILTAAADSTDARDAARVVVWF